MRKIFTTLKSVVAASIVASMTLAASCSYDDAAINDRVDRVEQDIDKVEKDLAALTERVDALEQRLTDEVTNLTALINGKVVVTGLEKDGDATKVNLSDGSSFTVYPECDVVDTDTDTNTYISIAEQDGVLYFAVYEMGQFKEWLLVNGEMVPVYDGNDYEDGECDDPYTPEAPVAPQFRVNAETGNIEVSIDGGATWTESGLSAAATGMQVFTGVKDNGNGTVTFTLFDGSTFDVTLAELIEFNTTRGQLYVKPGETKELPFTINDSVADVNIMNQPLGWKAEVALAENNESEGDDVDPGMGILAAGGTEFVLKITGPSQDFINAGYAETKGFISVHFNSTNGACKVGKIAVEMAEITLDIDKAGNVTVVSTWVDEYLYSSWEGEQLIQEFNNYYVCVMPIEYYVEDLSQIYNASWYEFDVPSVGGWINNFFYNVNPEFNTYDKAAYAEGVNEKWEFKATVEEIIDALDWDGTLTYDGNSFMVLVIPTDPKAYGSLMLDQALAVPFKQLNVNVEVVETTWNNAYFNATLRGANAYQFNINNKADLENQIANGWYADFETYYNDYIFYWQNYGSSFGSHRLVTDVAGENISFNDLINYGEEYPYWFEMAPNTTYIVAILAEEDGKTEYTYEDLKIIEFTTEDVVAAATPFEYTIELDTEKTTYFNIYANVTVPETAVAVYSRWYDEEFLSEEELKADLLNLGWMKTDFTSGYTYELSTSVSAAAQSKYLGLLIIDAEGNYSTGWGQLQSKAVVVNENVTVTIENVEFFTADKVAEVTLGGLEGVEYTAIKAYVCTGDADSYYLRDEAALQDLAYGDYYNYIKYTTNPFTVTRTADYKYNATEGKIYIVAAAVQLADGSVSNVAYGEYAFGEIPEPLTVVSAAATAGTTGGDMNYYTVAFTMSDESVYSIEFRTDGNNWLTLGEYTDSWSNYTNGYYPGYINYAYKNGTSIGWAYTDVAYENDAYTIKFRVTLDWQNFEEYTYTGAIDGLVAPGGAPEEGGDDTGEDTGETEDGVIYVNTFVGTGDADSYSDYFHLSDGTGNNEVKFVVCAYDGAVVDGWPVTNEYTSFQSSVSYVMGTEKFSFVNKSLIVNGTTYSNSEVSNASASVDANGNITINFTVGGSAYTFKHNK